MTIKEMNTRLAEITPAQIDRVSGLVRDGYGARGIKHETGLPVRLINAVFHMIRVGR